MTTIDAILPSGSRIGYAFGVSSVNLGKKVFLGSKSSANIFLFRFRGNSKRGLNV